MNDWQSFYPNFQPNQVLTSENLNDLRRYVDEQNRLTRLRMSGMGIACGLSTREYTSGTGVYSVQIAMGYGISSHGYLLELHEDETDSPFDEETQTYYKTYTRFRVYDDPANYWVAGTAGNEISLPVYELLSDDDAEALYQSGEEDDEANMPLLEDWDTFQAVDDNCHSGRYEEFVIVLYLEIADESTKSCTANDCDSSGTKANVTVRALLVNPADVLGATNSKVDMGIVNFPAMLERNSLPELRAPRWRKGITDSGETYATLDSYDKIVAGYREVIGESTGPLKMRHLLADAIEEAFDRYGPFLGLKEGIDQINTGNDTFDVFELLDRLRLDDIVDEYAQYAYGFIKDLTRAYNEFNTLALELHRACFQADYDFPRHLQLGRVQSANVNYTRLHRNYWVGSALNWNQDYRFAKAQFFFLRILRMIREFLFLDSGTGPVTEFTDLKVIPGKTLAFPLEDTAIPYYYYDTDPDVEKSLLYKLWNPYRSMKGQAHYNSGYHANLYAETAPDFITTPLNFDHDDLDFYRIEGLVGWNYADAEVELNKVKETFGVAFNVVTVQLSTTFNPSAVEYECQFGDLHADFHLLKSCMLEELEMLMGISEFAEEIAPLPEFVLDLVSSIIENANIARSFLEGEDGDSIMEFFSEDGGGSLGTGDSRYERVQGVYVLMIVNIQQLILFGRMGRVENLRTSRWEGCSVNRIVESMEQISQLISVLERFMSKCSLAKLHTLFMLYCQRMEALEAGHTSIFRNFAQKHPGLEHMGGVPKGGTFVMVVAELEDATGVAGDVLADFALPYLCCNECDRPDIDPETEMTPFVRSATFRVLPGESLEIPIENLLTGGNSSLVPADVEFTEGAGFLGLDIRYETSGTGSPVIVYDAPTTIPPDQYGWVDTVRYVPEGPGTGYKPYGEGVISILIMDDLGYRPQAYDDYAATTSDSAIIIDVLLNDCQRTADGELPVTDLQFELVSGYDADGNPIVSNSIFTGQGGNAAIEPAGTGLRDQVRYTPDENFQGQDTFRYRILDPTTGLYDVATVYVSVTGCCCDADPIDCSTEPDTPIQIGIPGITQNMTNWTVYLLNDNHDRFGVGMPVSYPPGSGPDFVVTLGFDSNLEQPWYFDFEPASGWSGLACFEYETVYGDGLQICKNKVCVHVMEPDCEPAIITLPLNQYCDGITGQVRSTTFDLEPAPTTDSTVEVISSPGTLPFNPIVQVGSTYYFIPNNGSSRLPAGQYVIEYSVGDGRTAIWTTEVVEEPVANFTIEQIAETGDSVTFRFNINLVSGYVERYVWNFADGTPDEDQSGNATFIEHTFDLVNPPSGTPPWNVKLTPVGAGCTGAEFTQVVQPVIASFTPSVVNESAVTGGVEVTINLTNQSTSTSQIPSLNYEWYLEDPKGDTNVTLTQTTFSRTQTHVYGVFDPQVPGNCLRTLTLVVKDTNTGVTASHTEPLILCAGPSGSSSSTGGGISSIENGEVIEETGGTGTGGTLNAGTGVTRNDLFGTATSRDFITSFYTIDTTSRSAYLYGERVESILGSYFERGAPFEGKTNDFVKTEKMASDMKTWLADATARTGLIKGSRDASSGNVHIDALQEIFTLISAAGSSKAAEYLVQMYSVVLYSLVNTAAIRDGDLASDSRLLTAFTGVKKNLDKLTELNLYEPKDATHPINLVLGGLTVDARSKPNFAGALTSITGA